jgi:hypothetical protein
MIGLGDAGLDHPGSEPVRRHLEYARRAGGHIDLVVDSPSGGITEFGALTVHRTGSVFRLQRIGWHGLRRRNIRRT